MGLLPSYSRAELDGYLSSLKPGDLVTRNGVKSSVPSLAGASRTDITALFSHLAQTGIIDQTPSGNVYKGGIEKPMPPAATVNRAYPVSPDGKPATTYVHPSAAEKPKPAQEPAYQAGGTTVARQGPIYPIRQALIVPSGGTVAASRPGLTPEVAYEFFDPNPDIFRADVLERHNAYGPVRVEVNVLTRSGIQHGTVIADRHERGRRLYEIVEGMDGLVLVRRVEQSDGLIGGPMRFEPLINIRPEDNATSDGKPIATAVAGDKILHLPIVGQSVKQGVTDGLGYVEAGLDGWGRLSLQPVFVKGAGNKVWRVLPEVYAKAISKERKSWFSNSDVHAFYIGEVPMTAEEKTQEGLKRVDHCMTYKRNRMAVFDFNDAAEGGYDYLPGIGAEQVPAIDKLLIMSLGLFRDAREAGLTQEVAARVGELRSIIARIAALKGLSERERAVIHGMYQPGSPEYESFMKWWLGGGVDNYINQLDQAGKFGSYWDADETPVNVKKDRKRAELSAGVPFREAGHRGFFDSYPLGQLAKSKGLPSYLAAVNSALGIAGGRILDSYNWRARFSMDDVQRAATGLVDEALFWDAVSKSFKGVDVDTVWKMLLQMHDFSPREMALWDKIAQPYVEKVKKAAAG